MGTAVALEGDSRVIEPLRVPRSEVRLRLEEAAQIGAVVVGVALTGVAAARLLALSGIAVTALDEKEPAKPARDELEKFRIPIFSAGGVIRGIRQLPGAAFALFSPGVSPGGPLAAQVWEKNIPSLAELDLLGVCAGDPLVAVTGTNGKSTTTTLIYEMLRASGEPVELIGNIGTPFVELLTPSELKEDLPHTRKFVAEISSYQLEWASECRPKVAVWLNLAENHLERHQTMDRYLTEKQKIVLTQTKAEFSVLNADDPLFEQFRRKSSGTIVEFGAGAAGENCGRLIDGKIVEIRKDGRLVRFDLTPSRLLGEHNRMNLAAASTAALFAGATEEGIRSAIQTFPGLEHRLEPVRKIPLVINDSKATTAHAAAADLRAVLSNFPGRPVTLLVGGLAKLGSWNAVAHELSPQVRRVIGFGKDGPAIIKTLASAKSEMTYESAPSLKEAVERGLHSLSPEEILLFAPGCPSFDAYSGFEERGRDFKRIVGEALR